MEDSELYSGKYLLKRSNGSTCDVELIQSGQCIVNCDGQRLMDWSILHDKRLLLTNAQGGVFMLEPIDFDYYRLQSRGVVWILKRDREADTLLRK